MGSLFQTLQPALLLLASLTSLRALRGPFLFDDPGIWDLPFTEGYPWRNRWRPMEFAAPFLLHVGYWLNWKISGYRPWSWHLVNTALHVLNVFMVWSILGRIWPSGAFWAAGVFAVHPLQTAATAYISGRGNLQSFAFALAGILVALHFGYWWALPFVFAAWSTRRDAFVYLGYFAVLFLGAK